MVCYHFLRLDYRRFRLLLRRQSIAHPSAFFIRFGFQVHCGDFGSVNRVPQVDCGHVGMPPEGGIRLVGGNNVDCFKAGFNLRQPRLEVSDH